MDPSAIESASATTPGFKKGRQIFSGRAGDRELRGQDANRGSSSKITSDIRGNPNPTIVLQPITGGPTSTKPDLKPPVVEVPIVETPIVEEPVLEEPVSRGGAPPENPISQGILNLLFICFLYWVSTKILLFYGISNDIYLVYFMFYVFLYVTTLLLPTTYERFD